MIPLGRPLRAAGRLLVVDDIPELREMLARSLRVAGWAVASAPDGRTALALSAHETWAAAVLDVDLPDTNGFALLGQLRALQANALLPVVLITGRPDHARRTAAASLGGSVRLIGKPFTSAELQTAIAACLRAQALVRP